MKRADDDHPRGRDLLLAAHHGIDELPDVRRIGDAVGVHVGPFAAGAGGGVVFQEQAVEEEVQVGLTDYAILLLSYHAEISATHADSHT